MHTPRGSLGALGAVLVALLVAGCASGPLPREGVASDVTPKTAADDPAGARDQTVIWGGVIANARNLEERTRLEVVSYPLDEHSQRPRTRGAPQGRFLAYEDGYLETAEFTQGRRVTLRGRVTGTEQGRVGEADYTYPTVAIERLELWPRDEAPARDEPRFHFGIGIILSN